MFSPKSLPVTEVLCKSNVFLIKSRYSDILRKFFKILMSGDIMLFTHQNNELLPAKYTIFILENAFENVC